MSTRLVAKLALTGPIDGEWVVCIDDAADEPAGTLGLLKGFDTPGTALDAAEKWASDRGLRLEVPTWLAKTR